MAITSYGYAGTLSAQSWSQMAGLPGPSAFQTGGSMGILAVSGSRAVSISAGTAISGGVMVVSSTAVQVNLPTPSAGQWFLVCLERNWATSTSTFVAIAGPTTSASSPGYNFPNAKPSGFNENAGTIEDQPVCWAWVTTSSTTVTIADCRAYNDQVVATAAGLYTLPVAKQVPGTTYTSSTSTWSYTCLSGDWYISHARTALGSGINQPSLAGGRSAKDSPGVLLNRVDNLCEMQISIALGSNDFSSSNNILLTAQAPFLPAMSGDDHAFRGDGNNGLIVYANIDLDGGLRFRTINNAGSAPANGNVFGSMTYSAAPVTAYNLGIV